MQQSRTVSFSLTVDPEWPPAFDDSALAPADLPCPLPFGTVYNARDYGAFGDGVHDDTVAIRNLLSQIKAIGQPAIVYLPGTYAVCRQPGDPSAPGYARPIFRLDGMHDLVFIGDGPTQSHINGYFDGLTDPVTHWQVTGDSYWKISRFAVFAGFIACSNIQFRSLHIDGQAGWTGNYTVGGSTTTGDGWDLGHNAIRFDGNQPIDNILIFNCNVERFRGEIIYAGSTALRHIKIVNSAIDSSNGQAISTSTDMLCQNSRIGSTHVNSGFENFCITADQKLTVKNSTVTGANNGLTFIGVVGASCLVDDCDLTGSHIGILLSEAGHDITIRNSRFTGNGNSLVTSIVGGLYQWLALGFSNVAISGNTFTRSGISVLPQNPISGLSISSNSVNGSGCLIDGTFLSAQWAGYQFSFTNNVIGAGCTDIGGQYADTNAIRRPGLWSGTLHPVTMQPSATMRCKYDDFSTATTGNFRPLSDYMWFNTNRAGAQPYLLGIHPLVMAIFPDGFTFTCEASQGNFRLKADPAWNVLSSDLQVTNGLTLRLNPNRLFEVVL